MSPQGGKIRVLIAARERAIRDELRRVVMSQEGYEVAATAVDGQEAVQLAVLLKPEIAIVKADLPIFDGYEAAEMMGLAVPQVRGVLVGNGKPDLQLLTRAMRSGLRAYVSFPVDEKDLLETLEAVAKASRRLGTPEFQTATDPSQLPKVVCVTGGKGGIGKSTISASLSMCLAKHHPGKVVLIDLYTQFGDIATMLNVRPTKTLCDLVQVAEEIDLEMLEGYMVEHETGVKVLVAATSTQPIDAIGVASAESVLYALKRAYTHIVVDLPSILHATTLYMLTACYEVLLVTTLFDMPTVRDAKELYDTVVGAYVPKERARIVANRVSKHDKLSLADVERVFGRKVDYQIPNDPRLVSAINQGIPFVRAYAKSPLVSAIEKIALELDTPSQRLIA